MGDFNADISDRKSLFAKHLKQFCKGSREVCREVLLQTVRRLNTPGISTNDWTDDKDLYRQRC